MTRPAPTNRAGTRAGAISFGKNASRRYQRNSTVGVSAPNAQTRKLCAVVVVVIIETLSGSATVPDNPFLSPDDFAGPGMPQQGGGPSYGMPQGGGPGDPAMPQGGGAPGGASPGIMEMLQNALSMSAMAQTAPTAPQARRSAAGVVDPGVKAAQALIAKARPDLRIKVDGVSGPETQAFLKSLGIDHAQLDEAAFAKLRDLDPEAIKRQDGLAEVEKVKAQAAGEKAKADAIIAAAGAKKLAAETETAAANRGDSMRDKGLVWGGGIGASLAGIYALANLVNRKSGAAAFKSLVTKAESSLAKDGNPFAPAGGGAEAVGNLNRAFNEGGVKAPFERIGAGTEAPKGLMDRITSKFGEPEPAPKAPTPAERGLGFRHDPKVDDSKLFGLDLPMEKILPRAAFAEGGLNTAIGLGGDKAINAGINAVAGPGTADPNGWMSDSMRDNFKAAGMGSLAGALVFKGARGVTQSLIPKGKDLSVDMGNAMALRNKLSQALTAATDPKAASAPFQKIDKAEAAMAKVRQTMESRGAGERRTIEAVKIDDAKGAAKLTKESAKIADGTEASLAKIASAKNDRAIKEYGERGAQLVAEAEKHADTQAGKDAAAELAKLRVDLKRSKLAADIALQNEKAANPSTPRTMARVRADSKLNDDLRKKSLKNIEVAGEAHPIADRFSQISNDVQSGKITQAESIPVLQKILKENHIYAGNNKAEIGKHVNIVLETLRAAIQKKTNKE